VKRNPGTRWQPNPSLDQPAFKHSRHAASESFFQKSLIRVRRAEKRFRGVQSEFGKGRHSSKTAFNAYQKVR